MQLPKARSTVRRSKSDYCEPNSIHAPFQMHRECPALIVLRAKGVTSSRSFVEKTWSCAKPALQGMNDLLVFCAVCALAMPCRVEFVKINE